MSDPDRQWLHEAIELSRKCPPSDTAFSVGALIVGERGQLLASGYSRETDPLVHAEEAALHKLTSRSAVPDLVSATLYSSLEPSSRRASRPVSCAQAILKAGIGRVVFAWREPIIFTDCDGAELLRAGGVAVLEVPELAGTVRDINGHLLSR